MAKKPTVQTKNIVIRVGLDEDNMPVEMQWQAEGSPARATKAMLLSLFDAENKETMKIDLWTLDMQVVEMDHLVFNTLRGLADTYFKATQNQALAVDFQRFVQYFGEKTEIIK